MFQQLYFLQQFSRKHQHTLVIYMCIQIPENTGVPDDTYL